MKSTIPDGFGYGKAIVRAEGANPGAPLLEESRAHAGGAKRAHVDVPIALWDLGLSAEALQLFIALLFVADDGRIQLATPDDVIGQVLVLAPGKRTRVEVTKALRELTSAQLLTLEGSELVLRDAEGGAR